jgi:hypothetical protein
MITIRPSLWRPGSVLYAVVFGAIGLAPVIFQAGTAPEVSGLAVLAVMATIFCFAHWSVRLEITAIDVRAREGWSHGPAGQKQAVRSEIRSIHYRPTQISFRGADGQSLLEAVKIWTVADMVKVAEELGVPLYDDRVEGLLKARELPEGRLVYDPASGPVPAIPRKER